MPMLTLIALIGKSYFIHLFLISGKIEAGKRKMGFFPLFFLIFPNHRVSTEAGVSPGSVSCVLPANTSIHGSEMPLSISLQNKVFNNLFT